jgi:hypothetical protein
MVLRSGDRYLAFALDPLDKVAVLDAALDCDEFAVDVDDWGAAQLVDAVGGGAHLVSDVTSH